MDAHPIAEWLLASRLAQAMPNDPRKPWTQDHFLALLETETGWRLHRPQYSKYETGKMTPGPDTLDKFVAFWKRHDVDGPDLTPAPAPAGATEPADKLIAALQAQTDAIMALVAEMREGREKEQDVAAAIFAALEVLRPNPMPGGGAASTVLVSRSG